MSQICLNLSCPRAVGEQIGEYLLQSPLLPRGFNSLNGSTHGADFAQASFREKVRGCIDIVVLTAILPQDDVAALLKELRTRFRSAQVHYWTAPVQDFGDLG